MRITPDATRRALFIVITAVLAGCGAKDDQAPAAATPAAAITTSGSSLADCDKLPDPKPVDESATARATATSEGLAARAACKKNVAAAPLGANADLARIREIKEAEQQELAVRKRTEAEWGKSVKDAGSKPVSDLKY